MPVNNLIQLRRGSDWSSDPILSSGEPGFDVINNQLKIGDGSTVWSALIPVNYDLNNYDITGTGNINITGDITAISGTLDVLSFNTDNESILTKGQISWDDTEGTMDIGLTANTTIHIGEHRYFRIRNETGDVLYKGQAVYATGIHSNGLITPAKYVADGSVREIRFMGLVLENVNNNSNGYIVDFGHLENMDLDGSETNYAVGDETWVAGDILYVHPTVPGKLTKEEPKHSISIAIILDAGNGNGNGRMFVRPTSYGHLDDNHDVAVSGATNGQFLQYNSATDYWVPSSSGNFTTLQVNGTAVPTGVGTTNYLTKWTGTNSIGTGVIYDNGTNVGIGTDSPSYKLDVVGTGHFDALNINNEFTFPTTDGTANQVLQTDGEGTLSFTGAPTFTALTVDTNTLYVDATNHRIGIGTTSPAYQVEIENNGANALLVLDRTDGAACFIEGQATRSAFGSVGATPLALAYNSLAVVLIGENGAITVNPDGDGFTFPTTDGSANQYLKTDGNGNVSWSDVSGGGGGVSISGYENNRVLTSDGTSDGINAESKLIFIPEPSGNKLGIGTVNPNGNLSLSNGSFGVDGDSQKTFFTARVATSGSDETTLFLDGSSTKIELPPKSVWNFHINISCFSDTNEGVGSWNFRGCIKRNSSTTAIVGSLIEENFIDTEINGATATVTANSSTNSLDINVTGLESNDIRWTAGVDIVQTTYDVNNYVYFLPMMYDMVP